MRGKVLEHELKTKTQVKKLKHWLKAEHKLKTDTDLGLKHKLKVKTLV